MAAEREVLSLEWKGAMPEVGAWLSGMDWVRRDTLAAVEGLSDEAIDRRVDGSDNTIGTLLYHVALVEADWLLEDIFQGDLPWPENQFPWGDRNQEGILTVVEGTPLREHLQRLEAVRALFVANVRTRTAENFHRLRSGERFDVSPAWVLWHLIEHEVEHRVQIGWLRERLEAGT